MRAGSCREISAPVWEASKFSARSHTPARRRPPGLAVPICERAENFKRLLMRGGNFVGSCRFSMRRAVRGLRISFIGRFDSVGAIATCGGNGFFSKTLNFGSDTRASGSLSEFARDSLLRMPRRGSSHHLRQMKEF